MRVDGSSAGYYRSLDPDSETSGTTRSTERKATSAPVEAPTRPAQTDSRAVAVLHEVGNGIAGAVLGFFHGLARTASDVAHGSLRALVRPFEAVASIAVFAFAKVTSAVLTAIGVEPKGRRLNDVEHATLQRMFGGSLDLSAIRIKEHAGAMSFGDTPRTIGDTIYFPGTADLKTLQHEAVHAWQFSHGGTLYLAGSLEAQAAAKIKTGGRDAAYRFEKDIQAGRAWRELNPEQQAELMETAAGQGYFASDDAPKHTRVISASDGRDYTHAVEQGLAQMRAGKGAP
jgi:hypothetical protein